MVTLRQLLEEMVMRRASDLHLTAGVPPEFRVDGSIIPSEHEMLTPESTGQLAYSVMSDEQDRKSTRLNSSHIQKSRMPSSA